MSRTKIVLAGLFLCSALVMTAAAQKNRETPVTSIIEGNGVNNSPTLRIQSDQLGSYTNSSSVQSILQSYGDWVLDTDYAKSGHTSSSPRKVLIDFRDPTPPSEGGGNPTALFPLEYGVVTARFISKCTQFGEDTRNMFGVGSTQNCPLFVAFEYGANTYRIDMDGTNYEPGITNPAMITCQGVNSTTNQCVQWRFEPSVTQTSGEKKNVGKLLKVVRTPKLIETDMGNFYMSFTIDVTNP